MPADDLPHARRRKLASVLARVGVVALLPVYAVVFIAIFVVISSFDGCLMYRGQPAGIAAIHHLLHKNPASLPTSSISLSPVERYAKHRYGFSFEYDTSKYVLNDNQSQQLNTWFGKGADFAMTLMQRGKPQNSLECASLSIDVAQLPPSVRNASISSRKVWCCQVAAKMDEGFKKAMTSSRPTIVEAVTVDGMPAWMVERAGTVEGTSGRFRVLVGASRERSYVVVLWTPESEEQTESKDFDQMMNTFVVDAL
jgi:hypothetical protein